jgi:hypothetical protein
VENVINVFLNAGNGVVRETIPYHLQSGSEFVDFILCRGATEAEIEIGTQMGVAAFAFPSHGDSSWTVTV